MALNLLFSSCLLILLFSSCPFGRFPPTPWCKEFMCILSLESMDCSSWARFLLNPNGCVGCPCADEAKVYSLYYSPGYYSSKLVGEGRSGLVLALLLRHSGQLPLITSSALLFSLVRLAGTSSSGLLLRWASSSLLLYYCLVKSLGTSRTPPLLAPLDITWRPRPKVISNHFWWTLLTSTMRVAG